LSDRRRPPKTLSLDFEVAMLWCRPRLPGRSNASIVKIGVVAKKHNKALAFGQYRDPAADPELIRIVSVS